MGWSDEFSLPVGVAPPSGGLDYQVGDIVYADASPSLSWSLCDGGTTPYSAKLVDKLLPTTAVVTTTGFSPNVTQGVAISDGARTIMPYSQGFAATTDLTNWTTNNGSSMFQPTCVAWNGSVYAFGARRGSDGGGTYCLWSGTVSGTTISFTGQVTVQAGITDMVWVPELGLFVAVGFGAGGPSNHSVIFTSPNAATWTQRTGPGGSGIPYAIVWTGKYLVCLTNGGEIWRSADGVTWVSLLTLMNSVISSGAYSLANIGGTIVASGASNTGSAYSYDHGATWGYVPPFFPANTDPTRYAGFVSVIGDYFVMINSQQVDPSVYVSVALSRNGRDWQTMPLFNNSGNIVGGTGSGTLFLPNGEILSSASRRYSMPAIPTPSLVRPKLGSGSTTLNAYIKVA